MNNDKKYAEDLEKEIIDWAGKFNPAIREEIQSTAYHFAYWQKAQMMEMRWRKSSFGGLVPLSVIREMDADGKYYYHLGVTCPAGMEYFPVDKIQED